MALPKVLIADDERHIAEGLQMLLTEEGYDVDTATDGRKAWEKVSAGEFGLVLADLKMPKMDGLEVARALREAGDLTPILMLTARDAVSDRVAGLDAGADDYLVKPFALEELLARVMATADSLPQGVAAPIFLKVAPDLEETEIEAITEVVAAHDLAGVIVSNTLCGLFS